VVSIVAVIIGVRMHSKNSDLPIKENPNTAEPSSEPAPAPAPAPDSAVDTSQLKIRIEELSAENKQLKTDNAQIVTLKQERDNAKEDARLATEKSEQTIKDANLQTNQLNEKIKTLETDNSKQASTLKDVQKELSIVKKEKGDGFVKIKELETSLGNLESERNELQNQNKKLQKDLEDKTNDFELAESTEQATRSHANELIEENTSLKQAKKEIEDQILTLKEDKEKAMKKPALSTSDFIAVDVESTNEKTQTDIKKATSDASFFDFTAETVEPVLSQSQPVEGIQLKAEKVDVETETDAGITNELPMEVFTKAIQTIQQELTKYEGETANRQSLLEHRILILQNKLSELKPQ
jgi:DNA repair exonuclease SbcCD ATPase subunit